MNFPLGATVRFGLLWPVSWRPGPRCVDHDKWSTD